MQATAILLNWQRHETMARVIEPLLEVTDDILVVDNSGNPAPLDAVVATLGSAIAGRVRYVSYGRNLGPSARWRAALSPSVTRERVLFQDDDYVVRNWPALIRAADERPGDFVHALDEGHRLHDHGEYMLVGWGAVARRSWIRAAVATYRSHAQEDALYESKADRILTALMRPSVGRHVVPADVEQLKSATSKHAMYRQPDHAELVRQSVQRIQEIKHAQQRSAESVGR